MKLKRLTQIIPKAIVSTGLAALLTGCAALTLNNSSNKPEDYFSRSQIGMYIPAGETPTLTNCSYMDKEGDGKLDFREMDIETIGEYQGQIIERTISVVNKYNKKGKLIPAPIVITNTSESIRYSKESTEITTTLTELHDCGTTKLQGRYQLPELQDYNPDGIPDWESEVEVKQYPIKESEKPQIPAPRQTQKQNITKKIVTL